MMMTDDAFVHQDVVWEALAADLGPAADYLPLCFQSQPRPAPSSQLSGAAAISFTDELLQPSDVLPDQSWKFKFDNDDLPGTQLDMVSSDQILDSSSLLYSPTSVVSVAPVPSPPLTPAASPTPFQSRTTAEELLGMYFSPSAHSATDDIADEDLLEDLDDILSSYVAPKQEPGSTLDHIHVVYNPPADTVDLALSSQYVEGIYVYMDPSQQSLPQQETADQAACSPKVAASSKGKTAKKPTAAAVASKWGRKRKASVDSKSAEERKRKQNAEAAKNYRIRKAQQMNDVFKDKEEVEKELEKARKKLQGKLNERNILLKMLYESYKESGGQSAPHKILFPAWIETWYQKQQQDD